MQCVRCNGVMDRFVERVDSRNRGGAEGWRCLQCGVVPGIMVTTPFARWRKQVSRSYAGPAASPSLAVTETSSAVIRPVPRPQRAKVSVLRPRAPALRLVANRRTDRVVERVRAMDRATDAGAFRLRATSRHLRLVPSSLPAQRVDSPTAAPRCAMCDAPLETEVAQREHKAMCLPASSRALGLR